MDLTIDQGLSVGARLCHAGNHRDAIGIFRGILIIDPKNVEAMVRLGASLFELNRWHEALFHFWRARKLDRRNPMALMNYGLTLSQLGYPEEGIEDIERAVRLGDKLETSADVRAMQWNNFGNCLERLGRHDEALEALDRGLRFDPSEGFAHYNRGIVLLRLNRQEEAKVALKRSLELANVARDGLAGRLNEADARYNLGLAELLTGELEEGFKNYEHRLTTSSENPQQPNFGLDPARKWHGQTLNGGRLLVHGEQGLGDAIQMLRFLPRLRALGPAEILFVEHAGIRPVLRDEPGLTVLEPGESLLRDGKPRYDVWTGVMSLPLCFGITDEDQIPEPYTIKVDDDRLCYWEGELANKGSRRVAICWAGNFRHKNDKNRSIRLETFARILQADVNFVSVQQVRDEEKPVLQGLQERHSNLTVLTLDDLRDTAAVLMNCDLLVTVDTAIAHLGGSLGVPTWTLIPKFGTDWRWQLERTDSPWYPSMTLYRQHRLGDWNTILSRVEHDLAKLPLRVAA